MTLANARCNAAYLTSAINPRLGLLERTAGGFWVCIDGVGRFHDWDVDSATNHIAALAAWLDQESDV